MAHVVMWQGKFHGTQCVKQHLTAPQNVLCFGIEFSKCTLSGERKLLFVVTALIRFEICVIFSALRHQQIEKRQEL